jgi:hypothetical protein
VAEASVSRTDLKIHRIMLFSGILTITMVYAALSSEAALRSTCGESFSGPVADIVVRNWGAFIALVGVMSGGSKCAKADAFGCQEMCPVCPTW